MKLPNPRYVKEKKGVTITINVTNSSSEDTCRLPKKTNDKNTL